MARRLFNIVRVASLLSCIAAMALWAWSDIATISYVRLQPAHGIELDISGGGIWLHRFSSKGIPDFYRDRDKPTSWLASHEPLPQTHPPADARRLGFGYERWGNLQARGWDFTFPFWALILGLLVLPSASLAVGLRRCRRLVQLRCAFCGYDLRASPNRCPECGYVPENVRVGN